MFNTLEFVKDMYLYSYRKDNRLYSPISFDKDTYFSVILPLGEDDNKYIDSFVDNVLKDKIFKIESKADFFKTFETYFYLNEPLEDVLSSEGKMNAYLENMQGYHDYNENESLYIAYSGLNDGVQHAPLCNISNILKYELQDSLDYEGDFEDYIHVNKDIIEENESLINQIAIRLQECLNAL